MKSGMMTVKATYAEHIRKLFGLYDLSVTHIEYMKCALLFPERGISKRYFARWLGLTNLNDLNDMIELGLLK